MVNPVWMAILKP